MYNSDYMSKETFEKIQCPVLLMNGDRDGYSSLDEFIQCAKYIRNAQVALIPGCSPCYLLLQFSRSLGVVAAIFEVVCRHVRKCT